MSLHTVEQIDQIQGQENKESTYSDNTGGDNNSYEPYINKQLVEALSKSHRTRFELNKVYELGQIGGIFFGKKGSATTTIIVVIYVIGVIISKCILTGKVMSSLFVGIIILDNYYLWMILFFVSCALFSFKDISSIKIIQQVIAVFRFIVILLFIVGPIYLIARDGPKPLTNFTHEYQNEHKEMQTYENIPFNFQYFGVLFSNLTFAYMMQHSLPAMVTFCRPESAIKKTMAIVFIVGGLSCLLISYFGILSFGGSMTDLGKENDLIYFNNNFKDNIYWIYFITSFYVVFNIAAVPVLTIVVRNNLMKILTPKLVPQKAYSVTKWTLLYTAAILTVVFISAVFLKNYIQYVLDITGGLFGMIILLGIPSLFLIVGRKECINKFGENYENQHTAIISNKTFPYVLAIIAAGLFVYNFYLTIDSMIKGAKGE